jgi:hypothetical protein
MTEMYYTRSYGFRTDDLVGVANALMQAMHVPLMLDEKNQFNGKFFTLNDDDHGRLRLYRHLDLYGEYGRFNPRLKEFGVIFQWEGQHTFPYHEAVLRLREFSPELIDTFVQDDDSEKVLEYRSWFPEQNRLVDMRDRYRNANDPE